MISDTLNCGGICRPSSFLVVAFDFLLLWPNLFYQTIFVFLVSSWIWCALPKFVLCFIQLEKAIILFLCIYIQKSYFLIMHYSWEAILQCVEHHSLIWYCIFLPFLNMTSVWKIHGEWWSNLCAFVFKCKITNTAHILVELYYMRLNISCLQLALSRWHVSLEDKHFSSWCLVSAWKV